MGTKCLELHLVLAKVMQDRSINESELAKLIGHSEGAIKLWLRPGDICKYPSIQTRLKELGYGDEFFRASPAKKTGGGDIEIRQADDEKENLSEPDKKVKAKRQKISKAKAQSENQDCKDDICVDSESKDATEPVNENEADVPDEIRDSGYEPRINNNERVIEMIKDGKSDEVILMELKGKYKIPRTTLNDIRNRLPKLRAEIIPENKSLIPSVENTQVIQENAKMVKSGKTKVEREKNMDNTQKTQGRAAKAKNSAVLEVIERMDKLVSELRSENGIVSNPRLTEITELANGLTAEQTELVIGMMKNFK